MSLLKHANNNAGQMIGTMSGIALSSILAPKIMSAVSSKAVPEVENMVRSPEFFNQTVLDTLSNIKDTYPGVSEEQASSSAKSVAEMMREEAHHEFIKKPTNPYFIEAQKKMGKASKKAGLISLALGLSLPILGSIAGSKIQDMARPKKS
jgi:hypothetical protein